MPAKHPIVLILSLSASDESQGRKLLPTLNNALTKEGATVKLCDIRSLPPVWVKDQEIEDYPTPYGELSRAVQEADGVILVVPVYCYAAGSPAKAITEILAGAFSDKPVGFVTSAGSIRSHLAIKDLMASMVFHQASLCFPTPLPVTEESFTEDSIKSTVARTRSFARRFLLFTRCLQDYITAINS